MTVNKDTVKALEAATTLIKYCARYKHCKGCIFKDSNDFFNNCAINRPFSYVVIKEDNE